MYMFQSKYENQSLVFFLLTCLSSTNDFSLSGYDVFHIIRNNTKGEGVTSLLRAMKCKVTEDIFESVT